MPKAKKYDKKRPDPVGLAPSIRSLERATFKSSLASLVLRQLLLV